MDPHLHARRLTVATLNCYLIPKYVVGKANTTCQHQDRRARGVGEFVRHQTDLCALQEVWGSCTDFIHDGANGVEARRSLVARLAPSLADFFGGKKADAAGVQLAGDHHHQQGGMSFEEKMSSGTVYSGGDASGRTVVGGGGGAAKMSLPTSRAAGLQEVVSGGSADGGNNCFSRSLSSFRAAAEKRVGFAYGSTWGPTILDIFRVHLWHRTGGLDVAFDESKLTILKSVKHTFTESITRSKKGVMGALFRVNGGPTGEPVYALVFNLHLDHINIQDNQVRQLREVKAFMEKTVDEVLRTPSFPGEDQSDRSISPQNLIVLCFGDFNIDGNKHPEITGQQQEIDLSSAPSSGQRPLSGKVESFDEPDRDWVKTTGALPPRSKNPNAQNLEPLHQELYARFLTEQPRLATIMRKTLFGARDLHAEAAVGSTSSPELTYVFDGVEEEKASTGEGEKARSSAGNSLCMFDSRRLDFILAIDQMGDRGPFRKIVCECAQVIKQPRGEELSDHWPVQAVIRF